ncbi:copper resistance protein B [Marinobacter sp. TBZ242]|uniref:Copper resistance protein B n=1 Tax=Marinobacter azerbaijanicus TaxID=3050455 RepID=A0ABT7IJX0_9GAMM|nr:copper resistance protein B [Marinobacter sp. TBZ242]MDL0434067.1 copper resistance protein B [Marinobacter sp. TBZ242]
MIQEMDGHDHAHGEHGGHDMAEGEHGGRLISDFWELHGGIGYLGGVGNDDHPERTHAVIGLQGLAPFYIETDLALRITEEGAEHDVRLTQNLYLQPRAELIAADSDVAEFHMGEGGEFCECRFAASLRDHAQVCALCWRLLGEALRQHRRYGA